jgi:hypothetical protein
MKFSEIKIGDLLYYGFYGKEIIYYVKGFGNKGTSFVILKGFAFYKLNNELEITINMVPKTHFDGDRYLYNYYSFIESDKLIKKIFSEDWKITKE